MSRKYRNPPIIEAVCEFQFTPDTKWDLAIPGLVYEELKDAFPIREPRLIQNVVISGTQQGLAQKVEKQERILFLTEDRKQLIQMGPRFLAANCLKPYPSWEAFKPIIEKALTVYAKQNEIKGMQKIGLHYINKIDIPNKPVNLDRYFEFRPFLGKDLPQATSSFIVGCLLPFSEKRDLCKVELTDVIPEQEGVSSFLLDIDYYLARPNAIETQDSMAWVEQAHIKVESIFEGSISDDLRKLLQEIV